jgi:hypothetical protein
MSKLTKSKYGIALSEEEGDLLYERLEISADRFFQICETCNMVISVSENAAVALQRMSMSATSMNELILFGYLAGRITEKAIQANKKDNDNQSGT